MNSKGEADPRRFVYLYPIVEECEKRRLRDEINTYMARSFDDLLLAELIALEVVKLDDVYLTLYLNHVNRLKRGGFIGVVDGRADFQDVYMINFIYRMYACDITLTEEQLNAFATLTPFERWALDPRGFDYNSFEADWLIAVDVNCVLEKLVDISAIKQAIERRLQTSFDARLAAIYFKYFSVRQNVVEAT